MTVLDLVARTKWALREADYVRTYVLDERFRALGRPENRGQYLSYFCYAGLANRFRSHFAASLVARELKRQVIPIWIETMHLRSDSSDVFEQEWSEFRGRLPHRYFGLGASSILNGEFRSLAKQSQNLVMLNFDVQWLPIADSRNVFGPEGSVEFHFRSDLVNTARELIASLVRPYLAVHIRQTDFTTNKDNYKSMSYFEVEIAKAVENVSSGSKFRTLLVASDDHVSMPSALAELFENVVVLIPKKGRRDSGVAAEALVHLLSLSAADGFVGTPRSSFSEFAEAIRSGWVVVPGLT
jgi:GDP-fucose protein O-fucosyltransferase